MDQEEKTLPTIVHTRVGARLAPTGDGTKCCG